MTEVIPITRSRDLIEHRAFVAGVEAAARMAEAQMVFVSEDERRRFARFAELLRRKAHEMADREMDR